MKPDGEHCCDMEEIEIDPSELFCQLGMLIVEARVPDSSPKGRVEGPHCPPAQSDHAVHHCQENNAKCSQAIQLQRQMLTLWRNRVPMCVEVLLYPDCEHGNQSALQAEATAPGSTHNECVMLEQWMLNVLPKRPSENAVPSRVLLQALRSYLHFSQISAWLNQTHGTAPNNLVYRITPPGDFCTNRFSELPDMHTFPVTLITRNSTIKITVNSLPRRRNIPNVFCRLGHGPQTEETKPKGPESVPLSSRPFGGARPKTLSVFSPVAGYSPCFDSSVTPDGAAPYTVFRRDSMFYHRNHPPSTSMQQGTEQQQQMHRKRLFVSNATDAYNSRDYTSSNMPVSVQPKQNQQHHKQLPQQKQHRNFKKLNDGAQDISVITKQQSSLPKSTSPEINHSKMKKDNIGLNSERSPSSTSTPLRTIESPKVLLTLKSPGQGYFSKIGHLSSDSDKESSGSSPDLDRYLKGLSQQFEPLSPSQMQVYLSSLVSSRTATPSPPPGGVISPSNKQAASTNQVCYVKNTAISANSKGLQKTNLVSSADLEHTEEKRYQKLPCRKEVLEQNPSDDSNFENGSCQNGSQNHESHTINGSAVTNGSNSLIANGANLKTKSSESNGVSQTDVTMKKSDPVIFTLGDFTDVDIDKNSISSLYSSYGTKYSVEGVIDSKSSPALDAADKLSTRPLPVETTYRPQFVRSPTDAPSLHQFAGFSKSSPLLKSLMAREFTSTAKEDHNGSPQDSSGRHIPTAQEQVTFRRSLGSSASMIFHSTTGLPLQSSPAPMKKITTSGKFDFDCSLTNVKAIKNSLSCLSLDEQNHSEETPERDKRVLSSSAPAAANNNNALLGNFEESILNGRIEPAGVVEGFTAEIGASGSFCPKHVILPVTAFFFSLSDDNEPSPYLGHINLNSLKKRGYYVPKKGTVQVTLFNPNKTVVKMFVVVYDLSDMPANCQTFLRQRSLYMPASKNRDELKDQPSYLRYLIHLRFASSKSGKIYLHTDIRLIFARDKFEYDSRVANYELRSFTDAPTNPKFSPKR